MILRKPYAFLIKYFKFIHFILAVILGYIFYKTHLVLSFFNEYLDLRTYETIDNLNSTYIPSYLYIAIIAAIAISIVIFFLMYFKDKPLKYYVLFVLYYIALSIGLIYISSVLQNITFNRIDVLQLQITRDILYVLYLGQIPFLIMAIVRATGFNIRKFNFQRDLMELNVSSSDNEEVELDIDIDSNDVKTRFRRRGRIILYVYKENKAIILAAMGVIMIVVGLVLYNIQYVQNKIYKEQESFGANGITMKVLKSYQMNTDSFGSDITSNKYTYTVSRIYIKNTSKEEKSINIDRFRLRISSKISYDATSKFYNQFSIFGDGRSEIDLLPGEEDIIAVIFQVDKKYETNKKQLEYMIGYKQVNGERIYNLAKVALKPINTIIGEGDKVNEVKLNEPLVFSGTILNDSSITITSFELKDRFQYQYQQCMDICYTFTDYIAPKAYPTQNMMVMRLQFNVVIDEDTYNEALADKLISSVGHIRYKVGDNYYYQEVPIANITPQYINDAVYYEVKKEISNASAIYIDFNILGKTYTYILKEE